MPYGYGNYRRRRRFGGSSYGAFMRGLRAGMRRLRGRRSGRRRTRGRWTQ